MFINEVNVTNDKIPSGTPEFGEANDFDKEFNLALYAAHQKRYIELAEGRYSLTEKAYEALEAVQKGLDQSELPAVA